MQYSGDDMPDGGGYMPYSGDHVPCRPWDQICSARAESIVDG